MAREGARGEFMHTLRRASVRDNIACRIELLQDCFAKAVLLHYARHALLTAASLHAIAQPVGPAHSGSRISGVAIARPRACCQW